MLSTVWAKFDRRYLTQQYLYFLLRHRIGTLVFILLSTVLFGYLAVKYTRVHTDFFELYPPPIPIFSCIKSIATCSAQPT